MLKLRASLVVLDSKKSSESSSSSNNDPLIDYNQLAVRIEPRILNVRVGESITIRCLAQGREPIEINWFKSTATNELIQETRILHNALVINSAVYSDTADYYCEARNEQGSQKARSRIIVNDNNNYPYNDNNQNLDNRQGNQQSSSSSQDNSMNVIVPPTVHIIPERQTIIQGKSGQLQCLTNGTPPPKITWIKARSELTSTRHFVIPGQNKSTLEIRDALVEDRGLYVCRSENSGGVIQQSSIVEIERREIPAIEIYPSAVQMLPQDSSALFQCRVTAGIPTPTIEWKKSDGTDLEDSENTEILPGGVLRFSKLSPEVQGRYSCYAYNSAGRVTADAMLHVQGSVRVQIKQTSPYRIRANDRVKLDCNLTGQTAGVPVEYRIEWRKMVSNNSQIQIPYISLEHNKASLIINQVNLDDSGHYICFGISTHNNQIIVQERIQLIVEPPVVDPFESTSALQVEDRVVRAQVDEAIELRCFIRKTQDNLKLNWFKRDSNLPDSSRVEDGVLIIEKVALEDDGTYVCTGYNGKSRTVEFTQDIRLAVVGKFYFLTLSLITNHSLIR